mmetsp:Transcript_75978/g.216865  ORF Transcript_75978/g.216865 Transcript_75978/m.216865 type:complete len:200 (+) Transcript_75978:789-1388(+)
MAPRLTTNSRVEDGVKRGLRDRCQVRGGDSAIELVVHKVVDARGVPDEGPNMKVVGPILVSVEAELVRLVGVEHIVVAAALCGRVPTIRGVVVRALRRTHRLARLPQPPHLHQVNLAARRPAEVRWVGGLGRGHDPDRRPDLGRLIARQLGPHLPLSERLREFGRAVRDACAGGATDARELRRRGVGRVGAGDAAVDPP